MMLCNGENLGERAARAQARRIMNALLSGGSRSCVDVVRAVAAAGSEHARAVLLERLETGPTDPEVVETLLEALLVAGVTPIEARLRRLATDDRRTLRVRGLAFEAWARAFDAVGWTRDLLREGPVEPTSDWLIAYVAGAMVRPGEPESAARLALLLAMCGRSARMLELIEHIRQRVGAAAEEAYGPLLEFGAMRWAWPRWRAAIDADEARPVLASAA